MQASLWGSILPAIWSFMLAARARGLGTCWTTLHLPHEREAAELLGIPYEEVMQAARSPSPTQSATSSARDREIARHHRSLGPMVIHLSAWGALNSGRSIDVACLTSTPRICTVSLEIFAPLVPSQAQPRSCRFSHRRDRRS